MSWYTSLEHFFFQAEDGIRDADVTGVQTCALPICLLAADAGRADRGDADPAQPARRPRTAHRQIGRASCRERVYISEVTELVKKKSGTDQMQDTTIIPQNELNDPTKCMQSDMKTPG